MQERSISVYIFRYNIYNIISTRVASSCVNSGLWSKLSFFAASLREDAHKKSGFLSDQTTKVCPPPLRKT